MTPSTTTRRPGRPRSFDREAALDAALDLFWRRGYEGVDVRELTAAMGIHPPSFYAAFGTKEQLFREAADRYQARYMACLARGLEEAPTARAAAHALWRLSIGVFGEGRDPRGCFLTHGAANCGTGHAAIAADMAGRRQASLELIRRRLERGLEDGDLPPETDIRELAVFVASVAAGFSVQARDGAGTDVLEAAAARAAQAIPDETAGAGEPKRTREPGSEATPPETDCAH